MNRAGSFVGARHSTGVWVDRAVTSGQAYPPSTSLTFSTPAFEANPTRRLPDCEAGGSSREQQDEKGRE
jgi:hypothetical protein